MGDWTTLNILMFGHTLWDTLLAQFTKHIGDQVKPLDDEIRYCFKDEFSSCPGLQSIQKSVGHKLTKT